MIDSTTEQIEALRAEVAELRALVNHPALAELVRQRDQRDAWSRAATERYAQQNANQPRPAWTIDSGVEPPTSITMQQLLCDPQYVYSTVAGKVAREQPTTLLLARCPDGSEVVEAAKAARLCDWQLEWDERAYALRAAEAEADARSILAADVAEQMRPLYAEQQRQVDEANKRGVLVQVERIELRPPRKRANAQARAVLDALGAETDALAAKKNERDRLRARLFGSGTLVDDGTEAMLPRLADAFKCVDDSNGLDEYEARRVRYLVEQAQATIDELAGAPARDDEEGLAGAIEEALAEATTKKRGWFR